MEISILCGIYLAELLCYQMGIRILFKTGRKTWKWMAAGILPPAAIGFLPVDMAGKNVLVSVSVICVMFASLEGTFIEKGARLLFILLLLECIDTVFIYFFESIFTYMGRDFARNKNYLAVKCCTAASVWVLNMLKKKADKYKKTSVNSIIYVIIGMIAASMLVCLGCLNNLKRYIPNQEYRIFCSIMNAVMVISIFLLIICVIHIKKSHERMEQLLKTEQILKESQIHYYKQALKKETDTRKYRHDMNGHLIYLSELLKLNKTEDAQKYLLQILGGFKKIQRTYYMIGNEMIEIVMNYFFSMLPENTEISISGKCPVKIDMEDTEICTVFSNVFQNAVEEITADNGRHAEIVMEVQKGREYVRYIIKNTLFSKVDEKNTHNKGFPKSHKSDKRNHGIGLRNVKETIERNNGRFEWYLENRYFCVMLTLPIKEC